jgi:hypothetical protein
MSDTEVGGIKGFLSLDDSAWDRTIAKVKTDVRELGAMDADVKVNADTARAEERIAVIHAAVRELGAEDVTVRVRVAQSGSTSRSAAASSAVDIQKELADAQEKVAIASLKADLAQQRLNEAEESGTRKASQLTAARVALAEATRRESAAVEKATALTASLNAEQTENVASAEAGAVAQNALASSSDRASASAGGMSSHTQLMGVAVAAVATLLGPATAGLVAFGGAAVGMGSAGVLAILGIKNAMEQGTATGQQYQSGLSTLKGDLDELSSTAAVGMLDSFDAATATINSNLPALNDQVSTLTGYLGRTGGNFLDGTIAGIEVAMPLFEQGAAIIERWSGGFESWMSNGGMQRFVDYAESELPRVAQTLEDVSSDAIELAADLAPVGDALQDVAQGMHGLNELQDGLDSIKGSLGSSGAGGGFLADVWTAAENALNPIKGAIDGMSKVQPIIDKLTGAEKEKTAATTASVAAAERERQATEATASTYGVSVSAYQAASKAAEKHASQASAAAAAMQLENDAAGLLNNALTLLNGGSLSLEQAQTGVAAATNTALQSFKDNKTAIDGNSEAAVANQQAIQAQVQSAQQLAQATATATGSTDQGVAAYKRQKAALEDSLRAQGALTPQVQAYIDKLYDVSNLNVKPTKLDIDKNAADAAIEQLKQHIETVPKKRDTKTDALIDEAQQHIDQLKRDIASVPASKRSEMQARIDQAQANLNALVAQIASVPSSKTVTITTRNIQITQAIQQGAAPGIAKAAFSHGGTAGVDGYAHGGTIAARTIQRFAGGGSSGGGSVWGSAGSGFGDKLPTFLSVGEEVANAQAMAFPGARAVVKAINANPANAMQALGSQKQQAPTPVNVYVTGDGIRDVIRVEIEQNGKRRKASLRAGRH